MRTSAKVSNTFTFILFTLACLFFVIFGAIMLSSHSDVTYAQTEAVIVDIISTYDYVDENYDHEVYVDYEVDGKEYENVRYNSYNSTMDIGDTLTINYNVEDPSEIEAPSTKTFLIIMIVVASLGVLYFAWRSFKSFIR